MPGTVVVTYGDMPLLRGRTLSELASRHAQAGNAVTVLTARGDVSRLRADRARRRRRVPADRRGTRRQRGGAGHRRVQLRVLRVRRHAARRRHQAGDHEQQPAARSTSPTWWRSCAATGTRSAPCSPPIRRRSRASTTGSSSRRRGGRSTTGYSTDWMLAGVTIVDPASTWVDVTVTIGRDAEIGPQAQLAGATVIGEGARIGPGCLLEDTTVGEDAVLLHAVCRQAQIGPRVTVGPFAYLRPGASIAADAHIGTYVELKKAHVGAGREGPAPHLRRRRDHRQPGRTSARARSSPTTTGCASTTPRSARTPSSAATPCSWRRSRSATAPTRRRDRRSRENVPAGDLGVARGRQHNSDGWVLRNRQGSRSAEAAKRARSE